MLAIAFPTIDPVLISIGPLDIRWYALSYIVSIIVGYFYAVSLTARSDLWAHQKAPISGQKCSDFLVWCALGIIVGGRLGYVIFYQPDLIWTNPLAVPNTTLGGMSFHGGLIGLSLCIFWFARRHKVSVLCLLDITAMATPIGLFLGRISNFINAELYGSSTQMPWGVIFPNAGSFARHPTQLYEAILEGIGIFILLRLLAYRRGLLKRPGFAAGLFCILYAIARIFVEFFRLPDAHIGYLFGPVTMGMVLSTPMIVAGGWLIYLAHKKTHH